MSKLLAGFFLGVLLLVGAYFVFLNQKKVLAPATSLVREPETQSPLESVFKFSDPKKSPHWEDNFPEHGSILPAAPVNVVVNFNFDLAQPSEIKILNDGQDYGQAETQIDANKLSLRRRLDHESPDGVYRVSYKACWPDGSCHEGNFQFAIDRRKKAEFEDETGKKELTIDLKDLAFKPREARISRGTKVTWVNEDRVEHYVNTDPHPGHNFYPDQNSKLLKNGDRYSFTFELPGFYPYHCSAHAQTMTASLLVD